MARPPRARRARPCFAAPGSSVPRSKDPPIPPPREAFSSPASPSRPSFSSDIFIFINHRPTGPSAELFLATMSCSFAAARHPPTTLAINNNGGHISTGSMLSAGPAPIAILDTPIAARACPANSPFAVDFATTPAAAAPARPLPPATLQGPFGDAALPAPPPTRQTASASTPTLPPWAWRSARDPRRRSSAARDPSPLLLLHSAPTSRCARVHPDHQCLASFMGPTTLGPPRPRLRPCGPCRGHSFQTRVTSPWSRYAPCTAPTRTLPSGLSLTTWSRPHGSSRPTRVPALSRTLTVTSPRPGSAPRHLLDSDAPDPRGSLLGPAGPPGSGPAESALSAMISH